MSSEFCRTPVSLDAGNRDPARLARSVEILAIGATEAPSKIRLFAAGNVETTKGIFKFDDRAARAVMDCAADYGNRYCFDYGHAMMGIFAPDPAEAGKAAGWFTPAVGADGALYADQIEWTAKAKAMILAREYRYVSPTFCHDDDGTVTELVNAALTNLPATKRMDPLMAARPGVEELHTMEPKILAALGLSPTSGIADVTAKITELQTVAARVHDAEKQLAGYREAAQRAEVAAAIREGTDSGKLTPAMLDWAGKQSAETLRAFLAVAPAVTKAPAKEQPASAVVAAGGEVDWQTVQLTAADVELSKKFGTSLEDAKKAKARLLSKGFIRQ